MQHPSKEIGFVMGNSAPSPHEQVHRSPPTGHQHQPFPAPYQQPVVAPGSAAPPSWLQTGQFANYLAGASSFTIKQKVELIEAAVGFESANKYTIYDERGNKIFHARETSGMIFRNFFVSARPFTLGIWDARSAAQVMYFKRPLDCSCCCGLFCSDTIDVFSNTGMKLGSVTQRYSLIRHLYKIRDARGKTVLDINGPICAFSCLGGPVEFTIETKAGVPVGSVKKHWGGFVREYLTDADTYGISFPVDLDPAIKAVCLAALFLIDFRHFEGRTRAVARIR